MCVPQYVLIEDDPSVVSSSTLTVRCDIMQLNLAASMINKTLLFPIFISLFFCYVFFPFCYGAHNFLLLTCDIVPYSFFLFFFVCLFVCFYTMTSDFSGMWNTVFIIFNLVFVVVVVFCVFLLLFLVHPVPVLY